MHQRHILLLDSDVGNRRNRAFLLRLAGYRVTEIGDADEALNRLTLCGKELTVDLLLICPGEAGLKLGALLGRLQQWQLPYLIVSKENGPPGPATAPQVFPKTCRHNDIIETLAGLWPAVTH